MFAVKWLYHVIYFYSLEEVEGNLRNRPSREEDVELIRQLQGTIMEQEILKKKIDEERKQYRLELVNREANFNRMFNASPNVGVLNPIEINKVCWKVFLNYSW